MIYAANAIFGSKPMVDIMHHHADDLPAACYTISINKSISLFDNTEDTAYYNKKNIYK